MTHVLRFSPSNFRLPSSSCGILAGVLQVHPDLLKTASETHWDEAGLESAADVA